MRWKLPDTVDKISVENQQFVAGPLQAVQRDGTVATVRGVDVPDHLDRHMHMLGFTRVAAPPKPPTDADGLRTDGPTYEEYVAAGYAGENYPPQGYASKGAPADTSALDKSAAAARKTAVLGLRRMSSEELGVWLVEHDVPVAGLTNRAQKLEAAMKYIGATEE